MITLGICKFIKRLHCYHDVFALNYHDETNEKYQICCHCGKDRKIEGRLSKLHGRKNIQVPLK